MKTKFLIPAGLVFLITGCTAVPTRHATTETTLAPGWAPRVQANVVAPVPVHTVVANYPDDLRRAGFDGVVQLDCLVDENGRVKDVAVKSASHDGFAMPAVDAVKKWTFTPGRRDGAPAPMIVRVPIAFRFVED